MPPAAPPVYRPQPAPVSVQPMMAGSRPVNRVMALPMRVAGVLQPYRKSAGTGGQGGNFIYGNTQVHLHIDIGKKSHLKMERSKSPIATIGGELDPTKIQEALNDLLAFQKRIANDRQRATNYAQPILDCIEWLTENGAKLPVVETTPPPTEKKKEEEKKSTPVSTGYGDLHSNIVYTPPSEDDFM
ncbi:MAG TPA: hypothetical protein VG273_12450 [Bryobacteraceae bacterium]|nr:hypothetical protein [Bryobacteraceae bacterium]